MIIKTQLSALGRVLMLALSSSLIADQNKEAASPWVTSHIEAVLSNYFDSNSDEDIHIKYLTGAIQLPAFS